MRNAALVLVGLLSVATAVQALAAEPVCGDVNDSGSITTSDALLVLRKSVQQPVSLNCSAYDAQFSACETSLSGVNAGLLTCNAELTSCDTELSTCQSAFCGDDAAGFGESCDGADLNGKTCATEAPSTPYGTLACKATCDGFDTSGCKARFTDNGDGTVTDNKTGLMWEKKDGEGGGTQDYSNPHDAENTYTWTAGATAPNGTAFTDFLDKLNGQAGAGTGFAGHYDWRLPTLEELQGIVDLGVPGCGSIYPDFLRPCINAVFGPTQSSVYWSSTTSFQVFPASAWYVAFWNGSASTNSKTIGFWVRAVRAAS